jgi:hypothetical protein
MLILYYSEAAYARSFCQSVYHRDWQKEEEKREEKKKEEQEEEDKMLRIIQRRAGGSDGGDDNSDEGEDGIDTDSVHVLHALSSRVRAAEQRGHGSARFAERTSETEGVGVSRGKEGERRGVSSDDGRERQEEGRRTKERERERDVRKKLKEVACIIDSSKRAQQ